MAQVYNNEPAAFWLAPEAQLALVRAKSERGRAREIAQLEDEVRLKRLRDELAGVSPSVSSRPALRTGDELEAWRREYDLSGARRETVRAYNRFARAVREAFPDMLPWDAQSWDGLLDRQGKSRETFKRWASAFFASVERRHDGLQRPKLRRAKVRRAQRLVFNRAESQAVYCAIETDEERVLWTMCGALACRAGDLATPVANVGEYRIHLSEGKEGADFVPILPSIRDAILDVKRTGRASGRIWPGSDDRARAVMKALYARADVDVPDGEALHVLRRSFLPLWTAAGGRYDVGDFWYLRHRQGDLDAIYNRIPEDVAREQLAGYGPAAIFATPVEAVNVFGNSVVTGGNTGHAAVTERSRGVADAIRTLAAGLTQLADALDVDGADVEPFGQLVRIFGAGVRS